MAKVAKPVDSGTRSRRRTSRHRGPRHRLLLLGAASATCLGTLTAMPLADGTAGAAARDTVAVGNPVAGNNGFGVVTEGDATLGSTGSRSPVAVGGDLAFGDGYDVSPRAPGTFTVAGDSRPTALLVGGRVDYDGNSPVGVLRVLRDGYVKIGAMTGGRVLTHDDDGVSADTHVVMSGFPYDSTPRIELTTRQPAASVAKSGLMDFRSLFSAYRDRADAMAECAANVTLLDGEGAPLPDQTAVPDDGRIGLALTPGRTNVVRLTGEQLAGIRTLAFLDSPAADTPVLLVVDASGTDGALTWTTPTVAGVRETDAPYVLWDFPDATAMTIASGGPLTGTLYAPRAAVTDLAPSDIEGDVVVKSLVAGPLPDASGPAVDAGEIRSVPFAAELSCETGPAWPV
ncbi:collagen-binding domain-containing protein [Streptomyces sp. NPDC053367]|uniref:collagen-binding domain-containing protein n=1 Tax=Streptomyces sp. NPDC053367 TaxID=3365700 RepID=UPI0037D3C913